ncbi:paxneb protein [Colletotrichum plurivorum]|uniref:Elongator complex protein 4 n=1 Tax=Colletotrichum plurivorum TaxID=2175906 RepID=A0A8H6MY16_9PEZI|nr:paxneb protein [Colletotrichum plurivorum]
MSFRKKNVVLGLSTRGTGTEQAAQKPEAPLSAGVRPSLLDGRLTISTGTASLDQLLAGHAGMPLGCNLLIEESGTTDFAGLLLKYYAAEGLVQGHQVHVLGPDESWRYELPGLGKECRPSRKHPTGASSERMKIAWRYETLGGINNESGTDHRSVATTDSFCHSFNLAKHLQLSDAKGELHATPSVSAGDWLQPSEGRPVASPLEIFLAGISARLEKSKPGTIHRVVIPNLLSPTLYRSAVCRSSDALRFMHGLRALLRQHSTSLTAAVSFSTSLYPRSTGFAKWMELLCDGVLELVPMHRQVHIQPQVKSEDMVQGMLRVHNLPIYHERGGGLEGHSSRENLSFRLSSSDGLVFKPYSLPPVVDEKKNEGTNNVSLTKETVSF